MAKSTNELYLEEQDKCLQSMNAYLKTFHNRKDQLFDKMKSIKDSNVVDHYLDFYNAMGNLFKSLALAYAIEAMMYEIKLINPNDLNDKVIRNNIYQNLCESNLIPDELKKFAESNLDEILSNLSNVSKDQIDFNQYIINKIEELKSISL